MNDLSDQHLLREYAEHRSDGAFAELVRRHVGLVHSAALRMVCEQHAAEDVTQGVFVALAQNAAALAKHPVLSGWLHCTARNIAAKSFRAEVRRRAREQEAAAMNQLVSAESEPPWEHIAPHLDEALANLNETDRDAVMLRYFEKKSAVQIAGIFGISDEAAQKRVSRAVDRLREFFLRRGVAVSASSLAVVLSANAVQAVPIGLATTVSTAVLTGTAVSTSAIIATTTKTIAMTTLQKTLVAAVAVLAGVGVYEARQASHLREEVNKSKQEQAALAGQVQQLQRERNDTLKESGALIAENARSRSEEQAELLKLRGKVGSLQNALAQGNATNGSGQNDSIMGGLGKVLAQMMDDPDARDLIRQQQRENIDKLYGPLLKQLGLTPEQASQFKDLLAENMMRDAQKTASLLNDESATNRAGFASAMAAHKQESDDQLRQFLGEAGFNQYENYQKTIGDRAQLNEFNSQHDGENSLSAPQTDQLLAWMSEEKQNMASTAGKDLRSFIEGAGETMPNNEQFERMLQLQETVNQRVYQRAGAILSPAQMEAFGQFQTNQMQKMRIAMTMAQRMFGSEEAAPARK